MIASTAVSFNRLLYMINEIRLFVTKQCILVVLMYRYQIVVQFLEEKKHPNAYAFNHNEFNKKQIIHVYDHRNFVSEAISVAICIPKSKITDCQPCLSHYETILLLSHQIREITVTMKITNHFHMKNSNYINNNNKIWYIQTKQQQKRWKNAEKNAI